MEPIPQQPTEIQILKSDAYDCLAQIEYWKKMLQEINQKIAQIQQQIKNP